MAQPALARCREMEETEQPMTSWKMAPTYIMVAAAEEDLEQVLDRAKAAFSAAATAIVSGIQLEEPAVLQLLMEAVAVLEADKARRTVRLATMES
jgi:hypothetical protein